MRDVAKANRAFLGRAVRLLAEAGIRQFLDRRMTAPPNLRGQAEIRGFFNGFELLDPGLVFLPLWRPDGPAPFCDQPERSWNYGGGGRKP